MKTKYLLRLLGLILSISLAQLNAVPNQQGKNDFPKKEFCLYLGKINDKEKALSITIPDSFNNAVMIDKDPCKSATFIQGCDPEDFWMLMTENIAFSEEQGVKIEDSVYISCYQACKIPGTNIILDHTLRFTHEDGVVTATAILDRPAKSFMIGGEDGLSIGPRKNECIFYRSYQANDGIYVIQYIKRYDLNATEEEKAAMKVQIEEYFTKNVFVTDYKGVVKNPRTNLRTIPMINPKFIKKLEEQAK